MYKYGHEIGIGAFGTIVKVMKDDQWYADKIVNFKEESIAIIRELQTLSHS